MLSLGLATQDGNDGRSPNEVPSPTSKIENISVSDVSKELITHYACFKSCFVFYFFSSYSLC